MFKHRKDLIFYGTIISGSIYGDLQCSATCCGWSLFAVVQHESSFTSDHYLNINKKKFAALPSTMQVQKFCSSGLQKKYVN